jgi:hypothetical protein
MQDRGADAVVPTYVLAFTNTYMFALALTIIRTSTAEPLPQPSFRPRLQASYLASARQT